MKYRKTKHIAHRIISGQAFIVNTATSTLHELDETGTFIWKLLDTAATLSQITERLTSVYAVSRQEAQKDVKEFLQELVSKGLIETDA